jgi:citrate synthase
VPGFGHGTHTKDPRSIRVFQLAEEVKQQGLISGNFLKIAKTVEVKLLERYKKLIAINIDGSIAAVACELGFPWQVGKGLFCLSRIIGITAHAYEESQSGYRIKTVMPPEMWEEEMEYDGPEERDLPPEYQN